jgi:AcrR family transcriptional regulator
VQIKHTVTTTARRAQILAATVEVIAEVGYRQASFARIVERAELSSTRMISYHFAGKEELMAAVVADVVGSMGEFVTQRMRGIGTAAGLLRAYIEGVVAYIAANRSRMRALLEILLSGATPVEVTAGHGAASHLEAILRQGQAAGEFRDFDPVVVATAVQRAVDGLPLLLATNPDLDCVAYGRELVTLFDLGTRS